MAGVAAPVAGTWQTSADDPATEMATDLNELGQVARAGRHAAASPQCWVADCDEITGLRKCLGVIVNPKKLETGSRTISAGIPYTLFLRIEAIGFPRFGLLL